MPEAVCLACGGPLREGLDLGALPLADALFASRADSLDAARYSLRLGRCDDCQWVQLMSRPPRELLFPGDYPYFSSVSEGVSRSAQEHAEELIATRQLGADHFVLEIASNDGYQLQWFQRAGVRVLGVDPAPGPVAAARDRGIETRQAFFDSELAKIIVREAGQADLILGKNVLAHVSDPGDFLLGVHRLLKPGGMASFEFPYLGSLLRNGQFDTIYHEHASYLAITPLIRLLERCGLEIVAIRPIDLHGGSLRVDLQHASGVVADVGKNSARPDVSLYLGQEAEQDVNSAAALDAFSGQVGRQIDELQTMVNTLQEQGMKVAAYGAAAKGVTLLNACRLDHRHIDFVVDRSPHKIGKYLAGTGIEIKDTSALLEERPDVVLLLAWNFVEEIRRQQSAWEIAGGRWLLPIPLPHLFPSASSSAGSLSGLTDRSEGKPI